MNTFIWSIAICDVGWVEMNVISGEHTLLVFFN